MLDQDVGMEFFADDDQRTVEQPSRSGAPILCVKVKITKKFTDKAPLLPKAALKPWDMDGGRKMAAPAATSA